MFIDVNIARCDGDVLKHARRLGFKLVACSGVEQAGFNGVAVVRRIDAATGDVAELRSILAEHGGSAYIAVTPLSLRVARWSAHDERIDTIVMTGGNIEFFDKKQFSAMKTYGKPLEVSVGDFLRLDDVKGGQFYRRVNLALRMGIRLVTGSGARWWWELYHPYVIVSMLSSMYDVPRQTALASITAAPLQLMASKKILEHIYS